MESLSRPLRGFLSLSLLLLLLLPIAPPAAAVAAAAAVGVAAAGAAADSLFSLPSLSLLGCIAAGVKAQEVEDEEAHGYTQSE